MIENKKEFSNYFNIKPVQKNINRSNIKSVQKKRIIVTLL